MTLSELFQGIGIITVIIVGFFLLLLISVWISDAIKKFFDVRGAHYERDTLQRECDHLRDKLARLEKQSK